MTQYPGSNPTLEAFREWQVNCRDFSGERFHRFIRQQPKGIQDELREMILDFSVLQEVSDREGCDPIGGRVFGDYRLIRELGRGGMGIVWEAEQISLQRRVALKLLPPQSGISPIAIERFQREAKAGGRLQHASLVHTYGVGENEGTHWIAQELVPEGRTLAHELAEVREADRAPDGWYALTAERFLQLASAMEFAHQADVLHRDIKPGNILIGPNGKPKIADFGLAHIHDDLEISHGDQVLGTLHYSSPEQAAPRGEDLDRRSDIFSLGSTLYEVITLRRPFDGDSRAQITHKIVDVDPISPQSLKSSVPKDLSVICGKCLEKNPERRYQTMAELADDLRRHLANEPILARPPSVGEKITKWCRRHPGPSIAAVAMFFISVLATWALSQLDEVEAQRYIERTLRASDLSQAGFYLLDEGGDPSGALDTFREAMEVHPSLSPRAVAGIAFATAKLNGVEAGIAALTTFPEEMAAYPDLKRVEAAILHIAERDEEASKILDSMPSPNTAIGWAIEGRRWMALSENDQGKMNVEGFSKASVAFNNAIFLSREANLNDYLDLAHAISHLTDPSPWAEVVLPSLKSLWPAHPMAAFWRGNTLLTIANFKGNDPSDIQLAIDEYKRALDLGIGEMPFALPTHVNLADSLRLIGQPERAIPHYREALRTHPSSSRARGELGSLLYELGNFEEGLRELKAACEAHPHDGYARTHLAFLYLEQERVDEAEAELRAVLKTGFVFGRTFSLLGVILFKAEKYEEAVEYFRHAIENKWATFEVYRNLGYSLHMLKNLEDSVAAYREALRLQPESAYVHCCLGLALKEQGQYQDALAEIRIGHELGLQQEGWSYPSAIWLMEAEKAAANQGM